MDERLVSRLTLARELGVDPQTIAKWERDGWFPSPHLVLSDRLILYKRDLVEEALNARHQVTSARIAPRRKKRT
jgi:transcriptional regulator with XRE-family HTH domain